MEFYKELASDPGISEYLKEFPEADWKLVIKKTLLYGIHSLKALENLGLTSPKLEKIPALHSELAELRKTVEEVENSLTSHLLDNKDKQKRLETQKESARTQNRPRGASQKQIRDGGKAGNSAAFRGSSKDLMKQPPFKLTGKEKPEVRRKLPKYLQNIDSKIKEDVQKSKKGVVITYGRNERLEKTDKSERSEKAERTEKPHNREKRENREKRDRTENSGKKNRYEKHTENETKWEEWKNVEVVKQKSDDSDEDSQKSSSSFSTYHAADEVKEFYQKEFSKLMPFGGNQKW